MDVNGESIYGTERTPLALQSWGVTTQKKEKLYLHVFDWPATGKLDIGGLKSNIKKAYLLSDPTKKALQIERINPLDLSLTIPTVAPDNVNTVIVLETSNPIETDTVRLLSSNSSNRLLVFDGEIQGKDFRFADGKANRYFVENWKHKEQKISWTARLNTPTTYHVTLKYVGSKDSEGTFKLIVDQKTINQYQIKALEKGSGVISLELGTLSLDKGIHHLTIEPVEITKTELMKPLEITLTPTK